MLANNIELDRRAAEVADQIWASASVETLAAAEVAAREALAGLDESLRMMRTQEALARRGEIELVLVQRQAELKYLDETSRKELNVSIAEVAEADQTVPDEIGLAEIEQRYDEIKARIEALGPVNPQALEEYQEAQQRYDFLNPQRQDLLDSIRDTEKAIHEIDARAASASRRHHGDTPTSRRCSGPCSRGHGGDASH